MHSPLCRTHGCWRSNPGAPAGRVVPTFWLTFYQRGAYSSRMSTQNDAPGRDPLLQGTLDLLVLRVLSSEPLHGHGIALAISARSGETLLVDHGSLYPALQRLEQRGWIRGAWGISSNNRRARFYSLTSRGQKQLTIEASRWNRLVESIARVMEPDPPATPENA